MGSYIKRINPYDGLLCVPYYYILITVIFSWIFALIWAFPLAKYRQYLEQKKDNALVTLIQKSKQKINQQLQAIFPNEIISIIIQMIGDNYINRKSLVYKSRIQKIDHKLYQIHKWLYYYVIRFIVNIINLITIMIRYRKWYNRHENVSNWDKYCAFIIALLYMPLWRGYGLIQIWACYIIGKSEYHTSKFMKTQWEFLFFPMFGIISFPVYFGGLFIYIPTTIAAASSLTASMLGVYYLIWKCKGSSGGFLDDYEDDDDGLEWISPFAVAITFVFNAFVTVNIVCTMELYSGENWVKAYRIGSFGEYCGEDDYFSFNKWNDYHWDIQLLIVSWFLF